MVATTSLPGAKPAVVGADLATTAWQSLVFSPWKENVPLAPTVLVTVFAGLAELVPTLLLVDQAAPAVQEEPTKVSRARAAARHALLRSTKALMVPHLAAPAAGARIV